MGNKNDYLTLEDSARMLGRPVSVLKSVMNENNITQTYREGRWSIKLRDLEKVRESLPPQIVSPRTELAVHDFLPKRPPRSPRRTPEPVERSDTRVGSKPTSKQ